MGLGVTLATKTFLINDGNQSFLVSPGPENSELSKMLDNSQKLAILAPNLFHHIFLHKYQDRDAEFYGPLEVLRKNQKLQKHLHTHEEFIEKFSGNFDFVPIEGVPKLHELVLYHKKDKTLIVTDISFNISNHRNKYSKFVINLFTGGQGLNEDRIVKFLTKDKKLFKQSLKKIIDLPFEKVLFHHGDPMEDGEIYRSFLKKLC